MATRAHETPRDRMVRADIVRRVGDLFDPAAKIGIDQECTRRLRGVPLTSLIMSGDEYAVDAKVGESITTLDRIEKRGGVVVDVEVLPAELRGRLASLGTVDPGTAHRLERSGD